MHPGFFFDDFDENQAGLLHEQVELLALLVRTEWPAHRVANYCSSAATYP